MQDLRKKQLILVVVVVAVLAPFLNKAFHIDDPLFLWMAQQIAKHPLDPYGFTVNWASFPEPFWAQMQNPPLCSYFIAAVASVVGWSEPALHTVFLIWPILSILGTFAIARRFCREPFTAALLTIFNPVFLVSATNLMCDVMLLALWVWAVEFWLAGLEGNRWPALLSSSVLIAAAALTKYFGIALVPLLVVYTVLRDWKKCPCLVTLLIPVAAVAGYEFWTKTQYGHGLLTAAMFFAGGASRQYGQGVVAQILVGLAFAGGCLIAPLLYAPLRPVKHLLAALGVLAAGLALFSALVPINPQWAVGTNVAAVRLEGGLFAAIGLGVIAIAVVDLVRLRDAESIFLALWLFGTFAFAIFLNWSITARTILPLAPVTAVLLVRAFGRVEKREGLFATYWRIVAVAIVSLIVASTDFRQANSAREAAQSFQQRFQDAPGTVWFQSHWGFQYYMQQWKASPLNSRDSEINSGDIMIAPANSTLTIPISRERVFTPEEVNFPVLTFVSTMGRGTGASFYSSIRGPIPWAIDHVPPEMYYVAKFR